MRSRSLTAGFSLPELLIASAAGLLLCTALIALYVHVLGSRLAMVQSQVAVDNLVVFRRLMGSALRPALLIQNLQTSVAHVEVWHPDSKFDRPSAALRTSDVLRVSVFAAHAEMAGHAIYYIARPAGRSTADTGLYRRVSRPEGGYYQAEELLSGVVYLHVELCHADCEFSPYLSPATLSAIRLHAGFSGAEGRRVVDDVLTLTADRARN